MIERYYSDARPKDFEDSLTEGYRKTSRQAVTKEKVVLSEKSRNKKSANGIKAISSPSVEETKRVKSQSPKAKRVSRPKKS
jgi:hypothetical protein